MPNQLDDKDGANKKYIDDNYLKLSGGTVTGHIILNNAALASQYQAISRNTGNAFFCANYESVCLPQIQYGK